MFFLLAFEHILELVFVYFFLEDGLEVAALLLQAHLGSGTRASVAIPDPLGTHVFKVGVSKLVLNKTADLGLRFLLDLLLPSVYLVVDLVEFSVKL